MNVKIPAPKGSNGTSIPLSDVVRIESRSLFFVEASAHNLYIILGKHLGEEFYTLLSYQHEKDMQLAYDTIAALLKRSSQSEPVVLELEPMAA